MYKNDIGGATKVTNQAQFEMWMSEIANLINNKPLTVIQTIELTSNKKFIGTTYGDLARAVGLLLKSSPEFRSAMVVLVHLNNGLVNYDEIASGDYMALIYANDGNAKSTYKGASDPLSAISGIVSGAEGLGASIANAVAAIKTAKTNNEIATKQQSIAETNADAAIKTELMRTVQTKIAAGAATAGASGADSSGGSNTLLIALVVFAGLAGVFLLSRSSPKTGIPAVAAAVPIKAEGGMFNAPIPPVAPPPAPGSIPQPAVIPPAASLIPPVEEIKF